MNTQSKSLIAKILIWRYKNIDERQFVMLLSIVIGLAVGFTAVLIKYTVQVIQNLITFGVPDEYQNYLFFAYPTIGITLVIIFLNYIIKQKVGHGIPSVLYAISKKKGKIKRHNMFSSIITSGLTVGFGGSVGLEGPTVVSGAAVGSNLAQMLHLKKKDIVLLLACACAGAMSAIFKAPIAAIVFALEVIMLDLTLASIIPLLLASASAALTSYLYFGPDKIYAFEHEAIFVMSDFPFYILLGVFTGFVSVYFTRTYISIEKIFEKIKKKRNKLLFGGITLGILLFFLPSLYGEGYEAIRSCLDGNIDLLYKDSIIYHKFLNTDYELYVTLILFLLIVIFKVVATSVTFGAGGVGGIFAPTLFCGASSGFFFAKVTNLINPNTLIESNFALVGMAGCIAGVLHAPLTAIFLIAELTGGYELFLPLMITATISYATVRYFVSNSVYTIQLAKRGELITHDKDKAILSEMSINGIIDKNFSFAPPESTLGDLVKIIETSERNIFPVVDDDKNLMGIVKLNDIRSLMFKPEKYNDILVKDLIYMPEMWVESYETMEVVAEKFQKTEFFNLPVIENGKYVGFVSRARLFSSYRRRLRQMSED